MAWLDTECATNRIAAEDAGRLGIVLEELLLNVVNYGGRPPPSVALSFERAPLAFELVVEDDGIPFDPTAKKSPDVAAGVDERPAGGLGIHLVMNLMDEVTYTRDAGHNRIVLRKFLVAT
jgi:anti-sigma regulatory factor (Ser/Thr protein kinase)